MVIILYICCKNRDLQNHEICFKSRIFLEFLRFSHFFKNNVTVNGWDYSACVPRGTNVVNWVDSGDEVFQEERCNPEVDEDPRDIIGSGNEGARCDGRVNLYLPEEGGG